MGYFRSGQFNITVSLRYIPAVGEIDFLKEYFEQASRLLYNATNGQHSLGTVFIATNCLASDTADIWIHPGADVWAHATGARLWIPGTSIKMSQYNLIFPFIAVHELSHYVYDLRDEYTGPTGVRTTCIGNSASNACIMEDYPYGFYTRWSAPRPAPEEVSVTYFAFHHLLPDFNNGVAIFNPGTITEFCHDANHDITKNNYQNTINDHRSCWSWMIDNTKHNNIPYALLPPPGAGPSPVAPMPGPPLVESYELLPLQRYMLVLDRSFSMHGPKINNLKAGAHFWVDHVNVGEVLGITTYAGDVTLTPSTGVPLTDEADLWRTEKRAVVDGITAAGSTAIGDAMRTGLLNIRDGGLAAGQAMVVVSDGLQTSGTETAEEVLPDILASHVKVCTIGLGPDQNALLLSQVARATGGQFFGISADLSPEMAAEAISDALTLVAGICRDNSGVMAFDVIDSAPGGGMHISRPDSVPFSWDKKQPEKDGAKDNEVDSFKFKVTITPGSTNCTLGVKWYNLNRNFTIKVVSPSGEVIEGNVGVRKVTRAGNYAYFVIDNPEGGKWTVIVTGAGIHTTRFRTIGFEVNPHVRLEANAVDTQIKPGTPIKLKAQLHYGPALSGVKFTATVRTPMGKWHTVNFHESTGNGNDMEEEKMYTIEIPTDPGLEGQYLVYIRATSHAGMQTHTVDKLNPESGKRETTEVEIHVPKIRRENMFTIVATEQEGPIKIPYGYNTKKVYVDPDQADMVEKWKNNHNKTTTLAE